ncbi:MAG: aspartate 1-decarboxylase [Caldimicrobium sp.]|nr:aspartate 1-decarboxylase [Caldimicrobium sp.]MDW8183526.1 aspartate 1-decarboxylase [Caldimicrobium sp.]
MLRKMLKVKIQQATVTDKNLYYEGSLTLDKEIMDRAGLLPFEAVWIYNINNGARFETYLIEGEKGQVILNGAAARLGEVGDQLIIAAYAWVGEGDLPYFKTRIIYLKEQNEIQQIKSL